MRCYFSDGSSHTPVSALSIIDFCKQMIQNACSFVACEIKTIIYNINGKLIKIKFWSECICVFLLILYVCAPCHYHCIYILL